MIFFRWLCVEINNFKNYFLTQIPSDLIKSLYKGFFWHTNTFQVSISWWNLSSTSLDNLLLLFYWSAIWSKFLCEMVTQNDFLVPKNTNHVQKNWEMSVKNCRNGNQLSDLVISWGISKLKTHLMSPAWKKFEISIEVSIRFWHFHVPYSSIVVVDYAYQCSPQVFLEESRLRIFFFEFSLWLLYM